LFLPFKESCLNTGKYQPLYVKQSEMGKSVWQTDGYNNSLHCDKQRAVCETSFALLFSVVCLTAMMGLFKKGKNFEKIWALSKLQNEKNIVYPCFLCREKRRKSAKFPFVR
jgi:hypothetical protein